MISRLLMYSTSNNECSAQCMHTSYTVTVTNLIVRLHMRKIILKAHRFKIL